MTKTELRSKILDRTTLVPVGAVLVFLAGAVWLMDRLATMDSVHAQVISLESSFSLQKRRVETVQKEITRRLRTIETKVEVGAAEQRIRAEEAKRYQKRILDAINRLRRTR